MQKGRLFIIAFILVVLCLVLYLFKGFLLVIIIGSLLAVATSNVNAKFLHLFKGQKVLAALCSTILLILFLIAPCAYAVTELAVAIKHFDKALIIDTFAAIKNYQFDFLPESLAFLKPKIIETLNSVDLNATLNGTNAAASIDFNALIKQALGYMGNFTKSGAKIVIDIALICVFYFFANLYGTELIIYLKSIVPIQKNELDEILREVSNVMAVVLYSMVCMAVIEGVLFAIIVSVFGYNGVFWGILFAFSSLIPAVGGLLVYAPLSLYEFASSGLYSALWILGYSIIVISLVADTFIKPLIIKWINERLVKTPTNINELLIFLAMLAGISTFGFWGIILGPAILTFFISTLKMYVILKEKNLL